MIRIIFTLLFFVILSCQKDTNPLSTDDTELLFPTKIGTTWTYSFVDTTFYIFYPDSFNVETDTIQLKIVKNKLENNDKKEIVWCIESKCLRDSLFLTYALDTLFFYTNSKYFTRELVLFFPLREGKKWKYFTYDYKVSTIDNLRLPFGELTHLFIVRQFLKREGNSSGENILYIKPGIGIVKFVSRLWTTMGDTNHHKVWQLLNFSESK